MEERRIACFHCDSTKEHVDLCALVAGIERAICCEVAIEETSGPPPGPPTLTDTQRLDKFEELLRREDEQYEFWFDPEARITWAGPTPGDSLREALDDLLLNSPFETQPPFERQ